MDQTNFGPVSCLTIASKALEQIVGKQNIDFMENKTILQPGSRPVEQVPLHRGLGIGAKSLWCQG